MLSTLDAAKIVESCRELDYNALIEQFNLNLVTAIKQKKTFFNLRKYCSVHDSVKERFLRELSSKGFKYYFDLRDELSIEEYKIAKKDLGTGYMNLLKFTDEDRIKKFITIKVPNVD